MANPVDHAGNNEIAQAPVVGPRAQPSLPNSVRYFPIVFFELFLLSTIAIFAFGPWEWPITNPLQLYSFLMINQAALLFGYILAVKNRKPMPFRLPVKPIELVWLAALVTLALLIPTAIVRTGGDINIIRAITNPGSAYNTTRYEVSVAAPTDIEYIRMVLSPLIWPLLPLTIVFWNRLSGVLKCLAVAGIAGEAFIYFLIGTNKGIVDLIMLMPWLLIMRSKTPSKIIQPKRVLGFVSLLVVSLVLFLPYFGANIASRSLSGNINNEVIRGEAAVVPKTIVVPGISDAYTKNYTAGITAMATYVGQGYYGLSLTLKEPFVWTYGVGHSGILTWLAEKAFGRKDQIRNATYPRRVDQDFGWSADVKWVSLYPWLASDVTFWGVPIIIFLIGQLLARTWLDAIGGNPLAVVLYSMTAVTLYYASANAQLFQASDTVFVFYGYLLWWLMSLRGMGKGKRSLQHTVSESLPNLAPGDLQSEA